MTPQIDGWDRWNQGLVGMSILVFLPLQLPQILQNMELMNSGDPDSVAMLVVISSLGYASGMLGNLLLMNFLAGERELWGAMIQGVGMITSGIVLAQLYAVGLVPAPFFLPFAAALGIGCLLNGLNFPLGGWNYWVERVWPAWQNCLRIAGTIALPAFVVLQLQEAFFPRLPRWPGGIGLGLLASSLLLGLIRQQAESFPEFFAERNYWRRRVLDRSEWLAAWLRRGWNGLAGWTANLLFMFGPLAQLINGFVYPDSLHAIALPTQFLCILGHLLVFSRSGTLLVRGEDRIWCFSSIWEIIMRLGILLCVVAAGLLSLPLFGSCLALTIGYTAFVFMMAKREYQAASLLKTLKFLALGKQAEATSLG